MRATVPGKSMKRRWWIALGLLGACGAIVGVSFSRPVQIVYHQYALDRLHDQIWSEPSIESGGMLGYGNTDQFTRQEYHCNQLVSLGHYFYKRYEMKRLPDGGAAHSALWKLTQSEFPGRRYPTLTYPGNVLEVWDLAEAEPAWDAFVARWNVADFLEQVAAHEAETKQPSAPE